MNESLQKVIRVLVHRRIFASTTHEELAQLSNLSRKTITRLKEEIETYASHPPKPSKEDETYVDHRTISYYIDIAIEGTLKSKYLYSNILSAIAGYVLRYETNHINHIRRVDKVINTGICFINLASQILSRKQNDGTPIHSKSQYAKYLLDNNQLSFIDALFTRSNTYRTGNFTKKWKLTKASTTLLQTIIDKTLRWVAQTNVPVIPPLLSSPICVGVSGTSTSPLYITVSLSDLSKLSFTSILTLLNHSHASQQQGSIDVSLANLSTTDPSIGRHYNVFTRIRSAERQQLGYINYDLSSGIQIIAFSLVYRYSSNPNLFETFPLLFKYGYDQAFKKQFRQDIASSLNLPIDEVKQLLTAYANGGKHNIDKHPSLKAFYDESDLLRREVISLITQCEPKVLALAISQSKKEFPPEMDWMSTDAEMDNDEARAKSSVFFFIWTYYEKQIRDAMLSVVDDGIALHDAIYSKHNLPCDVFEKAVLDQTGFEVKISH